MARAKSRFFCTSCGSETLKWEGRCPACGEWNSLAEAPERSSGKEEAPAGPDARAGESPRPRPLRSSAEEPRSRMPVGVGEVDRVLGGGLVRGSLVLLGGAPGIGKSTLLLQVAARLLEEGRSCLYVSGEESAAQVRMRAERIGGAAPDVPFLAATDVEEVVGQAREVSPELLCVDSIQTLHAARLDSAPGTVSQVREAAAHLQTFAKDRGAATLLTGHVTKQGGLAGPRTLEHLVDAVVTLSGERTLQHRILRAVKNRFGGVDEMAVFRMTAGGLEPVPNPSEIFLPERPAEVSGSAVGVPVHGSRPLLVEIQALAAGSRYSSPQRVATGVPSRRLSLLLAVLERRGGVALAEEDVFVNVVGGLKLEDPATDLPVLAALASAQTDRPLPAGWVFMGETGLAGEVRGVTQPARRVREAERGGMEGIVLPESAVDGLETELELRAVRTVRQAVELVRDGGDA